MNKEQGLPRSLKTFLPIVQIDYFRKKSDLLCTLYSVYLWVNHVHHLISKLRWLLSGMPIVQIIYALVDTATMHNKR